MDETIFPCRGYALERIIRDWSTDQQSLHAGSRILKVRDDSGTLYFVREVSAKRLGTSFKPWDLAAREGAVLQENHLAHVAHVHDYFEREQEDGDTRRYVISEWIEGKNLRELVQEGKCFTADEVIDIGVQMAAILRETATRGIVHRDVKPSNIMITAEREIYLTDFGFLQTQEKELGGSTIAGTIGYMAPEQLWGRATPQSDIFGLGATMAYLLTNGKEPHEMELAENLTPKIRPQLQSKIEEGLIDVNLVEICERAMHPLPEGRYKNAGELREALERCQRGLPKEEELIQQKMKEWSLNLERSYEISRYHDDGLSDRLVPLAVISGGILGTIVGMFYLTEGWSPMERLEGMLLGGVSSLVLGMGYKILDKAALTLYRRFRESKSKKPRDLVELEDFFLWGELKGKTKIRSAICIDEHTEMYMIISEKKCYRLSIERKEDRLLHYFGSHFGDIVAEEKEGNIEVLAKRMYKEEKYETMRQKLEQFVGIINERKQKYHLQNRLPAPLEKREQMLLIGKERDKEE